MKKIAVVLIMFLIILISAENQTQFSLLNYFSGEYVAYTSKDSTEDSIDLGFCFINSKPVEGCVVGESMVIENFEVSSALSVLNARVVKTEYLEDGTTVIYAYSNLINDKVEVFGRNVNLQVATKNERTVIGWPLILGSY